MKTNLVYIVGTGPGSPDYMTIEAQRAIKEASIIVGWKLNFFPVSSLIADKKVYLQDAGNYIQVAEQAAQEAREQGATVAVLRIGDPCLSSGLAGLLKVFHDFEVRVIPGISSVQVAAAIARINLDESVVISFHESTYTLEDKRVFLLDALRRNRHVVALTGQEQKPEETARYLIDSGINRNTAVIVGENLTLEDEKVFKGTLVDIIDRQFSWLSVLVIKQGDYS